MNIQRNTVQRQIVLESLKKGAHLSLNEIYSFIHNEHPSISKATVSRNLYQFVKSDLLRLIKLMDGLERFDSRTDLHHHFICNKCGIIFDIEIEYPEDCLENIEQKYNIQIDNHEIAFSGICEKCLNDIAQSHDPID
ncbi:MAG: transcriptional repressor [Eubacteriaceae bacterium]|nr:transcriptional repressor [Eubacteriaceae bacterium]